SPDAVPLDCRERLLGDRPEVLREREHHFNEFRVEAEELEPGGVDPRQADQVPEAHPAEPGLLVGDDHRPSGFRHATHLAERGGGREAGAGGVWSARMAVRRGGRARRRRGAWFTAPVVGGGGGWAVSSSMLPVPL